MNWLGVWFGAHPIVLQGDTTVFYQRQGVAEGTQAGGAVCGRPYDLDLQPQSTDCPPSPWRSGPIPIFKDAAGYYFDPAPWGDGFVFGGVNRLRQIVSCPGKSLEQILAGECVPEPSPSGAFVDGAPVW